MPVGNRLCDRGWMSWRQNGTMQAARCKCGRANWGQGPNMNVPEMVGRVLLTPVVEVEGRVAPVGPVQLSW